MPCVIIHFDILFEYGRKERRIHDDVYIYLKITGVHRYAYTRKAMIFAK